MSEQKSAPRFPARLILTTPEHFVAFGFGSGLAPKAPGTVGTLVGIPLFCALLWLPLAWYCGVVLALTLFAIGVTGASSRLLGVHDHPGIVFDEIVAYLVAALPLLPALGIWPWPLWSGLLGAFLLFRLFDIWKPWPISWLDDNLHGGLGIVMDDIAAGLASAALLAAAALAVPRLLGA